MLKKRLASLSSSSTIVFQSELNYLGFRIGGLSLWADYRVVGAISLSSPLS